MDTTSMSLLRLLREDPDDGDAWKRFVELYQPFIFGYLVRRDVRQRDAEDVAQDVLEIVYRELPAFEHNNRRGAFRKWLRNVTANRLRAFWRKQRRQPKALGGSDFAGVVEQLSDPDSHLSRIWDTEYNSYMVDRLLEMVAPRFQNKTFTAFRRIILQDHEPDAVATDLGMTLNAVRIAQARVLKAIRELGGELLD